MEKHINQNNKTDEFNKKLDALMKINNYKDKCWGLWEIKSLPSFSRLSILFSNNLLNKW